MLSHSVPELFLVVIAFIGFRVRSPRRRFSRRRPWAFRGLWPRPPWVWRWVFRGLRRHFGGTIVGRAYVTDGDGLRVSGYTIRMAGLDAPEWDQIARHQTGYWFNHGKRVKSALIQAIGGKKVRVMVEGFDKHGRVVGTVTCNGKDVGKWLVRNGHAIAAYGNKYKAVEREARSEKRGLWGYAEASDPRAWRHKKR